MATIISLADRRRAQPRHRAPTGNATLGMIIAVALSVSFFWLPLAIALHMLRALPW